MSLESLNRELQYWSDQADQLSGRVKKLRSRKSGVQEIKRNLSSVSGNGSRSVNGSISKCRRGLTNGIRYDGKDGAIAELFDTGKEEKKVDQERFLSQADDALDRELDKIDRDLEEAERSLKNAQGTVRSTRSAIREEQIRSIFQKGK